MIAANGFAQGVIDYEANLRALYYDLAGAHSPEVIRMLLTITTPDHLLYGSDYSTGAQAEFGEDEGLSLERARSRTIQGNDSVEKCKVAVGTNRGKAISSNCYSKHDCPHCRD